MSSAKTSGGNLNFLVMQESTALESCLTSPMIAQAIFSLAYSITNLSVLTTALNSAVLVVQSILLTNLIGIYAADKGVRLLTHAGKSTDSDHTARLV